MKKNIILIGFMGVGKGTIARALAKELNVYTIDTDDLIQSSNNKSILKIFDKYGEEYFRKCEKDTAIWLQNSVKNTIISTGGGFYKQENIKKIGTILYLKSSFNGIIKRIDNAKNSKNKYAKRPLLQDLQKAEKLFDIREKDYKQISDIEIDVENKTLKKIIKEIVKKV